MNIRKSVGIIKSWLDNDLYNQHQSYFFWRKWRKAVGIYAYKCRSKGKDLSVLYQALLTEIEHLSQLEFTNEDAISLAKVSKCSTDYCHALVGQKILDLGSITAKLDKKGDLVLRYSGPIWLRIFIETPLLATISQLYFRYTMTDEQYFEAHAKGKKWIEDLAAKLLNTPDGFKIVEGGTRRRFSVEHYCNVLQALPRNKVVGTSNVYYGIKYGIPVVGTMAHQLQMFYQAVTTLQGSVGAALKDWMEVFQEEGVAMGTALTDTLGDRLWHWVFDNPTFQAFFHTERHDSADPFAWGEKRLEYYAMKGIDTKNRFFLFSDSLDLDKAIALYECFSPRIGVKIMIGTFLTNTIPIEGHAAVSQVIKLMWANPDGDYNNMIPLVKLSADLEKGQGECETHTKHAVWVAENCPDVFQAAA
jgi:nicotinate phosphoribosyltransferase